MLACPTLRGEKGFPSFTFFLYQAFTFQLLTLFIEGKTLFRVFYTYTLYGRGNKTITFIFFFTFKVLYAIGLKH